MKLNISEIKPTVVPEAEVVYDEARHISFTLRYVDKKTLGELNTKHSKTSWNQKTHQREEKVYYESLRDEICKMSVVGWKGVTLEWLQTQMPIDESTLANNKLDEEIDFSVENLLALVENGNGIDSWILEQVRDPENFKPVKAQKEQVKN